MLRLLPLVTYLVFLCGCSVDRTWQDDHIDPEISSRIDKLNEQVIEGFVTKNPELIFNMSSDTLRTMGKSGVHDLVQQVGDMFNSGKYEIRNKFYLKSSSINHMATVMTGSSDDRDYGIAFQLVNNEEVVTVGEIQDGLRTVGMITIYGRYDDDWKLNVLRVGLIKIWNMDAIDWYNQAKLAYGEGDLIDAANIMTIDSEFVQPLGEYFHYLKEKEIKDFAQKLRVDFNKTYTFPIAVPSVSTQPSVFRVMPQMLVEGYFPMICYATKLDFSDTTALSKECDNIHKHIGELFRGVDKNNENVLYRAFERIPSSENDRVKNFTFVRHR